MLVLHTGLPGAGKTLNTIVEVKEWSEREKRPVYFYNIKGLLLPWIELPDPLKWFTVPPNSIVVMDEAQTVFRQRHAASAVPEHVAQFETHRHLGIDVVLITQDPRLLDPNVRRLVGRHVHFVRAFGANAATRIEWPECQEDPKLNRDAGQRKLVAYNKEAFNWYKSAEVHTHRFRIPPKIFVALGAPLLAGVAIYFAIGSIQNIGAKDRIASTVLGADASTAAQNASGSTNATRTEQKTSRDYIAGYAPRIPGLPHTAPVYDEVTKPVRAPYPAACVQLGERCDCYTGQATRIAAMDVSVCQQIVKNGFFQEWREDAENRPFASQRGSALDRASFGHVADPSTGLQRSSSGFLAGGNASLRGGGAGVQPPAAMTGSVGADWTNHPDGWAPSRRNALP